MSNKTIKIFISSPSDVLYERQIARRVIAKLGKEFAALARLEALLWEDMPLQATVSFQEGIDRIINTNMVDIAVFIVWSRLGTPLNRHFVKPDGSVYKSGTEYEFEMMYAANQQSGAPSILAYIKNAPITEAIMQSSANADVDFEEIGKQHKEAQRFIREKFYDPETKTVYGAYHQFEAPTTFEQKLTEHLRRLVIQLIGHEGVPIEWEGNPYVGLRSFRYDENAIFYGRRHTINHIEEQIARVLPDKAPCLFVLGESGSGKSSLVRAGLLPDLIEFGWIENTQWKWFDMMPSQFRGNIHQGLLSKLGEAFPVLNEKAIGKDLLMGKEVNFGHLADILADKGGEAVLFFIDQFEEIFTDPLITEEERLRTCALLSGMASTHKIWMIFSMRNDFYHKFTAYPQLSELKNNSIVFDLPKILHSELQEIVEEPAKKAGLKWEADKQGVTLNKIIINDINAGVDDLPLIEFALSELYNLRDESNMLTYKAYEKIGKIDGAVVQYVDNFYNTLSETEKALFYQLLSAFIAPSVENKNLYVRKTALLKDLQKTDIHRRLIAKLINSHILTSGKDEKGDATVSIVHEMLISSWKVIRDWVNEEKYFIDANYHYENLSKYRIEHGKSKNDLLQGTAAIKEAEYFLYAWENNCSPLVRDFLYASIKRKKRTYLPGALFGLLVAIGFDTAMIVRFFSSEANPDADDAITCLLVTVCLIYAVWKQIKAAPIYRSINVSLIFWPIFTALSIVFDRVFDVFNTWIICAILLPKCALTVFEKRAVLKWKNRIYTRHINLISVLLEKSTNAANKVVKAFAWFITIIILASLMLGVVALLDIKDAYRKLEITQKQTDVLFEEFDALPNLPKSKQITISRLHADYLTENFKTTKKVQFGSQFNGGWAPKTRYYEYAIYQYRLGYPESMLGGIDDAVESNALPHYSVTTGEQDNKIPASLQQYPYTAVKAAFELGLSDDCRKLLKSSKTQQGKSDAFSLNDWDADMIWTAEKVGLFELAKEVLDRKGTDAGNSILTVYQAHALLMTGDREKALSLYRHKTHDCKDNIEKDFAVFRWLCFPDTEIALIENELNLNRIIVYTSPADDANTDLAKPYTGKWQYDENGYRIQWEITNDNHQLCRYVFQTQQKDSDEWLDDDIALTRYRFKQIDGKTILEEYNARTNVLSVSEIMYISDNEIQVRIITNKGVAADKVKIYKRIAG